MYLQENTEEAVNSRQNVRNLLLSQDETNHTLALQLIQGNGMHEEFIVPLLILATEKQFEYEDSSENHYLIPLSEILSVTQLHACLDIHKKIMLPNWDCFIEKVVHLPVPFWKEWIREVFWRTGKGGKECYNFRILSLAEIIRILEQKTPENIDLRGFELQELPIELSELQDIYLAISLEHIKTTLPTKWQNLNLQKIDLSGYNITLKKLKKLFHTFPNWQYNQYLWFNIIDFYEMAETALGYESPMFQKYINQTLVLLRFFEKQYRNHSYYEWRAKVYALAENPKMAKICQTATKTILQRGTSHAL